MKKIVVVGSSNTDLVIRVPEIPRPGETLLGGHFKTFPGGKGANQAVACARAGGEVVFIASVGDDAYGMDAVRGYRLDNIHTEYIKVCRNIPSGVAMITISDNGENAIAVAPGANSELLPTDMDKAAGVIGEAGYMLIQLEIPLDTVQKALDLCMEHQTRTILNPAPAAELPGEVLEKVNIITPNETEAERLTGIRVISESDALKAAGSLHARGVETVIITMGSGGAFFSERKSGESGLIPGFKVNATDTTAAGDVFNGQLAVSLSEGATLRDSILMAHSAAALSVGKLGAQSSVPRRAETETFLKKQAKSQTS